MSADVDDQVATITAEYGGDDVVILAASRKAWLGSTAFVDVRDHN